MQGTQASTEFWKQGVKSGLSVCTDRLESWGQREEFRGSLVQPWAHAAGRGLGQRGAPCAPGVRRCVNMKVEVCKPAGIVPSVSSSRRLRALHFLIFSLCLSN